jgi:hypothetical protein
MRPVVDPDSLWYQLPRVAHWYQLGTFLTPMTQWEGPGGLLNFYPYNWNMLFLLALIPLGNDQFVLMVNVAAWLVLGLATYALARLVTEQRFGPMFAAILVLFLPLTIASVYTAHVDLPFGAFFVASVYFTLGSWRNKDGYFRLMALICVATMTGIKMSGIPYTGLVAALSLWLLLLGRLTKKPGPRWVETVRQQPLLTGLAVTSVGLLGVSWYVHNALVAGNPLGFVQISVLGRVLWHGEVTREFINKTNLLYNVSISDPHHWRIALAAGVEHLGLPGLILVMLTLAAMYSILRRPLERGLMCVLVCVCLGSLYLYVSGPWSAKYATEADISDWTGRQMRYSFPFWGLLATIAGAAIMVPPSGVTASIVVLLTTFQAIGIATEGKLGYSVGTLVALLITMFVFFGFRLGVREGLLDTTFSKLVRRPTAKLLVISGIVAALLVLISFGSSVVLRIRYGYQDALFGGVSRFINNLPAGTRVGFWATDPSYLLYGKGFQHSVLHLPLDAQASSDGMLRYLQDQPVDVIAVGPRSKFTESSPVWVWIAAQGEHFEKIHGERLDQDVLVYRLGRLGQ